MNTNLDIESRYDGDAALSIGDVVAAPTGNWGIVATETEPRESALVGMHGSLAAADQLIPLLTLTTT